MDDVLAAVSDADPVVSCSFQGGTVSVYEDCVVIERSSASMFDDKRIPFDEITGVTFEPGIMTGHVQIFQEGVEPGEGGLLSHPVDENTLYVARGKRECARQLRDAIIERTT